VHWVGTLLYNSNVPIHWIEYPCQLALGQTNFHKFSRSTSL